MHPLESGAEHYYIQLRKPPETEWDTLAEGGAESLSLDQSPVVVRRLLDWKHIFNGSYTTGK